MKKNSFLSCNSCETTNSYDSKQGKFPKICIGHVAILGAFIYILLTQLFVV